VWRRLVHRLPWLVVGLLGMLRRVIRQELLTGLTATAVAIGLPWLPHRLGAIRPSGAAHSPP